MKWHFLKRVYDPFVPEALRPYIQANNLLLTLTQKLVSRIFHFLLLLYLGICKWNTAYGQVEVGKFWYVFIARNKKRETPN